jgi:hypothetical protein
MTPGEFRALLGPNGDCLLWTGAIASTGYGRLGDLRYAHRLAYELLVGPIPEGHQVDHVAARGRRSRLCCRPEHLEAVTQAENIRRQPNVIDQLARTHCPKGHPSDEANTRVRRGKRDCRRCHYDGLHARRRVRRAAAANAGHTTCCGPTGCSPKCQATKSAGVVTS